MKSIILYSMNISELHKNLKTPIVIVGLGKSGRSAESFLLKLGYDKNQVLTFDEKMNSDIKNWADIERLSIGTLVVSPGVPLQSINIKKLVEQGWIVTSEINLASCVLKDEIVIGITGSVGKSTVTSILGAGAQLQDPNAFVGGNLGIPFCEYAISQIEKKIKAKYVILELSSYQLENSHDLKLKYSAITYLSANHLERYSTLHEYYMTKCQIGSMTEKFCIINCASIDLMKYQNEISAQVIVTQITDQKIALIGKHNIENYFVAETIAQKCGWSTEAIEAMKQFAGLPHRLEVVGNFDGITYINDSKATAMDSVLVAVSAALETVNAPNKLFLLLGGKDKNLPWQQLQILSVHKNIEIKFFGECANVAKNKSGLSGQIFLKMSEAINDVFKNVNSGGIVLLSPGGTSLDEFKNFEERGNIFKDLVKKNYSIK